MERRAALARQPARLPCMLLYATAGALRRGAFKPTGSVVLRLRGEKLGRKALLTYLQSGAAKLPSLPDWPNIIIIKRRLS